MLTDDEGPSLRSWGIVVFLTSTMVLSVVDRFGLSLMIEPIKIDLHVSDREIGLLNGVAFGLFFATLGIPLGWLSDRWSRKGVMALGVAMWTLATAACGLVHSFPELMAARILVGAGEAGLVPAAYSMISDRFPKGTLARAMSVFQVGGWVGTGLAFIIAGSTYEFFIHHGRGLPLIGNLHPWQQTFLALGSPGPLYVVILTCLRDSRKPGGIVGAEGVGLMAPPIAKVSFSTYGLLFLGMSGLVAASYGYVTWMPSALVRELHWSAAQVGRTYGLTVLVSAPVGLILGGWLVDKFVARGVAQPHLLVAFASAAISLSLSLVFCVAHGPLVLFPLIGAIHFTGTLATGAVPAFIQIITPRQSRGLISAIYVLIINFIGLGLASVLIGWISAQAPQDPNALRTAISGVVVPSLAGATVLLWLLFRRYSGVDIGRKSVEPRIPYRLGH
jgi:MFS family permease